MAWRRLRSLLLRRQRTESTRESSFWRLDQSPSIQVEVTHGIGVPASSVSLALASTTLKSGSIGWKAISDALGLVGFIWSEGHWQRPTLRDDTATKRGNEQNDPEPLHRRFIVVSRTCRTSLHPFCA
jgi:hypothetical protein